MTASCQAARAASRWDIRPPPSSCGPSSTEPADFHLRRNPGIFARFVAVSPVPDCTNPRAARARTLRRPPWLLLGLSQQVSKDWGRRLVPLRPALFINVRLGALGGALCIWRGHPRSDPRSDEASRLPGSRWSAAYTTLRDRCEVLEWASVGMYNSMGESAEAWRLEDLDAERRRGPAKRGRRYGSALKDGRGSLSDAERVGGAERGQRLEATYAT